MIRSISVKFCCYNWRNTKGTLSLIYPELTKTPSKNKIRISFDEWKNHNFQWKTSIVANKQLSVWCLHCFECVPLLENYPFAPVDFPCANGWIWQSQRLRNAGNSYDGYNKGNIYWIGRLCCQQNPKSCMRCEVSIALYLTFIGIMMLRAFFLSCRST